MPICIDHDYHRPFSVDNLSISWGRRWSLALDEISDLTERLAIPSKIQHLEIVLPINVPFDLHNAENSITETIDDFESFILDLHDNGSLRKLTFTFEPMCRDKRGVGLVDWFVKLKPLGILDIRVDSYSELLPKL